MAHHTHMPADIPRLFVSYSREDAEFALKLATDLRQRGTNIWVDQLDIRTGAHWDSDVEKGLKASPGVLVILSPSSVASQNVMDEVAFALSEGKWILPVRHKPCAIPFRLRRLQYVDFVDGYDEGLRRLVSDIAATFVAQPGTATESAAPPPADAPAPAAPPAALRPDPVIKTDRVIRPEPVVRPAPLTEDVKPPQPHGWRSMIASNKAAAGVALAVLMLIAFVFIVSENAPASDSPPAGNAAPESVSTTEPTTPAPEPAPPAPSWTAGAKHSTHPHVVAAEKEGEWTPENGYQWVDADKAGDLRVEWSPGKTHHREANVVAANKEGQWSPAPGYEWINAADANDLRVQLKQRAAE